MDFSSNIMFTQLITLNQQFKMFVRNNSNVWHSHSYLPSFETSKD